MLSLNKVFFDIDIFLFFINTTINTSAGIIIILNVALPAVIPMPPENPSMSLR